MPFFSVVIPLYNKENYILKTLDSILNQTFKDFEIIIINDGSTDTSESLIKTIEDSRVKLFTTENKGVSSARNKGVALAISENIALIDADDFWYPNHLTELKILMDSFPNAGLYCNNYEIYYTEDSVHPAKFNFDFEENCLIVNDFFKANIINAIACISCIAFKKKKFIALGGFNPELKTGEDTDFSIRFALKHDLAFNPKITACYNLYVENSLSENENNTLRYNLLNSFSKEEEINKSLKEYLDVNRYSLAIRCKLDNEREIYEKLLNEIDFNNLNLKQKFLLKFSRNVLIIFKAFQRFLLKRKIYLSAYK